MHEESALQGESSNLNLAIRSESTNSIWRTNGDPWLSALKGQNFVMFKVPKLITMFHNSVLPNHVDWTKIYMFKHVHLSLISKV